MLGVLGFVLLGSLQQFNVESHQETVIQCIVFEVISLFLDFGATSALPVRGFK